MPFGKYRGWLLRDIPEDYLRWLLSGQIELRAPLEASVKAELDARFQERIRSNSTGEPIPPFVDVATATRIVKTGRRALAVRVHPDTGGSNEEMALINLVADWLEEYLGRVLVKRKGQE
jgi:hypothetical protein